MSGPGTHLLAPIAAAMLGWLLAPRAAAAEVAPPTEVRAWPAVGAPRPLLGALGGAATCTPAGCDNTLSFGLDADVAGPLRATSAVVWEQRSSGLFGTRRALVRGDLAYERDGSAVWIGIVRGQRMPAFTTAGDLLPGVEYGIAHRWRNLRLTATTGRGGLLALGGDPRAAGLPRITYNTDSLGVHAETTWAPSGDSAGTASARWSSAEARLSWVAERWWVAVRAGRMTVADHAPGAWGGLQLGAEVGRGTTIMLGGSLSSRLASLAGTGRAQRSVSIGIGFDALLLSRRGEPEPPERPPAAAFVVAPTAPGRVRITIRASARHGVEFASDCTGWQPVPMTRTADGWVVELAARPGVHQADIRVDGGSWIAPPGLPPSSDDFAGEAGTFIIE